MVGIDVLAGLLLLIVAALAVALPIGIIWVVIKLVIAIFWLLAKVVGFVFGLIKGGGGRIFGFVRGEVTDVLGAVGSILAAVVFVPLVVGNVALGRWSRVGHYGRALEDEVTSLGLSVYRVALGHPIRLLGLTKLTDGIERRLPQAVASSPGRDIKEKKGRPTFPGYSVVGSLPRGGSGAHLYLAEPQPEQHDRLASEGKVCPGRVVIKSFSLEEGSSLPQIVRESRALASAKELGLVLDHVLEADRFYYAMPYVPGDDLGQVARRLHDRAGPEGLGERELRAAVGYAADVVASLDRFHQAGLWHKDIKPSNVIVSNDDHAYVVDLGLVTPLRSALTLTTHGTEYFRDPEMVRLAMQGVKVHEVDGVKFDLYSSGAVLFSLVENSFPAHGSLSQMTKRAPETLRWIVRRAMADLGNRYGSAREMLADLRTVAESTDPFGLKVVDLPSVNGDPRAMERAASAAGARTAVFAPGAAQPAADMPGRRHDFPNWHGADAGSSPSGQSDPWPKRWPWASPAVAASRITRAARRSTCSVKDAARAVSARTKHRSRMGFGTFAAVALFGIMSIVPVAMLMRHHGPSLTTHASVAFPSASVLVAERTSDGWQQGLHRLFADSQRAWDEVFGCERDRCRNVTRACELHPSALSADFDVLVLNDLPTGESDVLTGLEDMLGESDYTVWGLNPAASAQQREIELIAAARKAAGLGGPADDAAASRLRDLVVTDNDLDAVLWLGRSQREGGSVYRLVTGEPQRALAKPVSIRF